MFRPTRGTGLFTNRLAVAEFPIRAIGPVAVTVLVVFTFIPTVTPVTVTLKLQLAFAARDPPEKERLLGEVVV